MTETIENQPPEIEHDEIVPSCCKPARASVWGVIGVLVVVVAVILGVMNFRAIDGEIVSTDSIASASLSNRIDDLELRLKKIESQASLAKLDPTKIEQPAVGGADISSTQDIEKLKSGLAGLSGALGLLQTELERSSKVTNENNQNTQVGLATVLGYVLMQRAALSGQQFEKERQDLRKVSEGDNALVDPLVKLEPYALIGVQTPSVLHQEWKRTAGEAQTALRKANAHTWLDRIAVALEGLVSIRSLSPKDNGSLSFAAIDMDLGQGKLAAAQEKVAVLPPEVQTVIAPWRKNLDDRVAVELMLNSVAAHLLARGTEEVARQPDTTPAPLSSEGGL